MLNIIKIIKILKKALFITACLICLLCLALEIQIRTSIYLLDEEMRKHNLAISCQDIAIFYAGTMGREKLKRTINRFKGSNTAQDLEVSLKYINTGYVSYLIQDRVNNSNDFMKKIRLKYILLRQ